MEQIYQLIDQVQAVLDGFWMRKFVDALGAVGRAIYNDAVLFWVVLFIVLLFVLFMVTNLASLYREKRDERLAAEDRLRRQQRYEWEFRDLPETERRIKVYLAIQADMVLPRTEPQTATARLEPRLSE